MTWIQLKPVAGQSDTPAAVALQSRPRRLLNVYYAADRYIRRMGVQALHSSAAADTLRGLWALKATSAGVSGTAITTVFAGTAGATNAAPLVMRLIGSALVLVPYNGITVKGTSKPYFPWIAAEMNNDSGLACKRGLVVAGLAAAADRGALLHYTTTQVTRAGISAPTTGPTVGVGSATGLTGTWNAFGYSFVTADGHESNVKSTFGNVTVANEKLSWSALETPTNPRVTHWRLYRAKVGASNTTVFEMIDIPITTALPYEEQLADSTLGFRIGPITNLPPPYNPEHVSIWDECAFVTSNDIDFGGAGWPYSYVDGNGIPQFEAFDADTRVLRIPPRGGQRAMMSVPWDGQGLKRLALFTDSSAHVATPTTQADVYDVDELSLKHGVPGPSAAAAGGGWLVWTDGYRVLASDGGYPTVVSTDAVEAALKSMPAAMAERIAVTYRRAEGGFFSLSFASTSSSTNNDLELWWMPSQRSGQYGGWSEATYLDNGVTVKAPLCYGWAPSGAPTRIGNSAGAIDLAAFAGNNRVFWLDSPSLRDEGPLDISIDIEFPPLADDTGQMLVATGVLVAFELRRNTVYSSDVTPALSALLNLDANRSTSPKAVQRDVNRLTARCSSLGSPAATIGLRLYGACEPAIEIPSAWINVAPVGMRVKV